MKCHIFCISIAFGQIISRCEIKARDTVFEKIKRCKTLATREFTGRNSETVRSFRKQITALERKKSIVREKLCKKARFIYEPSGFITEIPPSWSCPIDKVLLDVYKKLSSQSLNIDESGEALNIVLVGKTGVGKSYFGNGLLGNLTPGRKEGVPFGAKGGHGSFTQNIHAASGILFGGLYDKELGLKYPMKINVFDTPGFSDSDPQSIRKNRLLISSAIRLDIHMVIYLTSNGRFTAEDQKSLKMINDWTAGQIWDHLVVVQGRFAFDKRSMMNRYSNGESFLSLRKNDKLLDFLVKRNSIENWQRKSLKNRQIVSKPIETSDFQKIRVSLLNMAQHRECYRSENPPSSSSVAPSIAPITTKSQSDLVTAITEYSSYSESNSTFEEYYEDNFVPNDSQSGDRPMNKFPRASQTKVMTPKEHVPTENCWRMPKFQFGEYETDYDYRTGQDLPVIDSTKIAFVEEARYFYTLLRKMKRNPIKPVTELFQFELNRDSETWQEILDKEHEIDEMISNKTSASDELMVKFEKCEKNSVNTSQCPKWDSWSQWSECPEECGGIKKRERTCLRGNRSVDAAACLANFGTRGLERDVCPNTCQQEDTKELMAQIMSMSTSQNQANQQQMMEFMNVINKQQQISQNQMAQMLAGMSQSTNLALKQIAEQAAANRQEGGGSHGTGFLGKIIGAAGDALSGKIELVIPQIVETIIPMSEQ